MKAAIPLGQELDLHPLNIDLADLRSVKDAAEQFQQQESRLNLLINNAGVMAVPYKLTVDGFETHWQINHLAPHLLFTTLLPLMRSTAKTSKSRHAVRLVNVSSDAAFLNGPKELDLVKPNLDYARGALACWRRYGHSKIASIIHARAIHNRYSNEGILAFSVHPGISKTNLQAGDPTFIGSLIRTLVRVLPSVSPQDAAWTPLFCATSTDAPVNSGGFFVPYGKLDHRADKWNEKEKTVVDLWDQSEKMLKEAGL
ncbi:MAG: hypothetical protein Q9170_000533 [Blastenia crenularia]